MTNPCSIQIHKLVAAKQHVREVGPRDYGMTLIGLPENLPRDCNFLGSGRSAEQHFICPLNTGRFVLWHFAQQPMAQMLGLGQHEVIVQKKQGLRSDRADVAFRGRGIGIGRVEQ